MTHQGPNRLPISSESTAEFLFIAIVIWMISGPVSGAVLSVSTWVSSLVTKSANQVESTRSFAQKLMVASDRIRILEKQLADDELKLTSLKEQSRDTESLRALLGLRSKMDRKTISADVITRNPDNWFEQVTIDKGTLDHIAIGSAVITNEGVVGQVVSASSNASVVRLLSDPNQKLGVSISRIGQPGVISGRHKNPAVIDYVPVGVGVDVGDKVVSLGNGGVFPANHPVGTVSAVRRDTNGTTLSIEVKLSENFYDLRQVLVVPPVNQ